MTDNDVDRIILNLSDVEIALLDWLAASPNREGRLAEFEAIEGRTHRDVFSKSRLLNTKGLTSARLLRNTLRLTDTGFRTIRRLKLMRRDPRRRIPPPCAVD